MVFSQISAALLSLQFLQQRTKLSSPSPLRSFPAASTADLLLQSPASKLRLMMMMLLIEMKIKGDQWIYFALSKIYMLLLNDKRKEHLF